MAVRIIVDSTADLPEGIAERLTVVPLSVRFGDEEFIQGVDITNRQFYEKLVESDVLPTTSQATPYQFEEAFSQAVGGGDTVVCITLSQKLSGTHQSAMVAAAEFPGQVYVVDSESVAIGAGILAQLALTLAVLELPMRFECADCSAQAGDDADETTRACQKETPMEHPFSALQQLLTKDQEV